MFQIYSPVSIVSLTPTDPLLGLLLTLIFGNGQRAPGKCGVRKILEFGCNSVEHGAA
jgi:hypothetical protein